MNYKIFIIIFISFFLSACSREQGLLFRYYLKKGNEFFHKQYYEDSKKEYRKAINESQYLKYLAENNKAIIDYELKDFDLALLDLERISSAYCNLEEKKQHCDEIFYNLGNTYYRIGEKNEDNKLKIENWQKAVSSYQKTLEINKDDMQAKENIEFILKLLEENQQTKNASSSPQKKEEGENQEGREKEEEGKENNNLKKEGEQKSEQDKNIEQNKEDQKLDKETNAKIDQYLQDMEEAQKNNQKYFQQKPNKEKNQDPLADFFKNDPFFEEFFNEDFGGFDDNENSNKKDW